VKFSIFRSDNLVSLSTLVIEQRPCRVLREYISRSASFCPLGTGRRLQQLRVTSCSASLHRPITPNVQKQRTASGQPASRPQHCIERCVVLGGGTTARLCNAGGGSSGDPTAQTPRCLKIFFQRPKPPM